MIAQAYAFAIKISPKSVCIRMRSILMHTLFFAAAPLPHAEIVVVWEQL